MSETMPTKQRACELQYAIDDVPPWYLTIILAFQHYLTMFGATIAIPLVISPALCVGDDDLARSEIMATLFFVSGLVTAIQTTFGVRLPIVQGGTFALISPVLAIMSLDKWQCPATSATVDPINITDITESVTLSGVATSIIPNITDNSEPIWHSRMREVQGAIISAAFVQVLIGVSGLMGPLLGYLGPLTIAPTIALIGISLFEAAPQFCQHQWGIAFLTIFLIILFSQYLRNVSIPCCKYNITEKKFRRVGAPIFKLFPVILAIFLAWFVCWIFTATDVFPNDPEHPNYGARTDIKLGVLKEAKWFRIPYPGQWGLPTFTLASTLGMLSGVLAGMIESIGDYYACARLAGAPPPPVHAINRGMFVEGLGCVIAGLFGTGTGTTSYGENIGAIGITKVGSRRVMQVGAGIMLVLGVLGKFGALFVTIPNPVVGGVFMVMFGMVTAVGVSNLQYVDLNSSRNLFVFGFSFFLGLSFPQWLKNNTEVINTGVSELDEIFTVLLTSSMFLGGVTGFILDNTIPGTLEERGMDKWGADIAASDDDDSESKSKSSTYDLPYITKFLEKIHCCSFVPISPTFRGFRNLCRRNSNNNYDIGNGTTNHSEREDNVIVTPTTVV